MKTNREQIEEIDKKIKTLLRERRIIMQYYDKLERDILKLEQQKQEIKNAR